MSKSSTEIGEDEKDGVAPKPLVAKFTSPTDGSMEELENEAVQNDQADAYEEGSTDVDAHTKPLVESNEYVVQDAQPVKLGLVQAAKDVAYENDPHLAASRGDALEDASNSDGCKVPDGNLIDHRIESKQQWDGTSSNLIFVM